MRKRKLTVNLIWANVFSVVLLIVLGIASLFLWLFVWGADSIDPDGIYNPSDVLYSAVFLAALLLGIVLHELIHGITWAYVSKKGWKSISFGVQWKMLTPYCHCDEPMDVRSYRIGAMMPMFVLGILPFIIGLAIQSGLLYCYGVFFIVAAAGDILIFWKIRKEPRCNLVLDHPTEAGCYIFEEGEEEEEQGEQPCDNPSK